MKVSSMSEEQKKKRFEELEKLSKQRKLTPNEAFDFTQIQNNWSEKEIQEFRERVENFKPIIM